MKFFKKFFWFFLILSIGLFCFNKPIFSQSATKVVEEFIKAGMDADYQKLATLCCKLNNGPYTTLKDVQRLNLSRVGLIEKIIREEKAEVAPEDFNLVVVRIKELGKIKFYCFFVFNTAAGKKILVEEDYYMFDYPQTEEVMQRNALGFYWVNKLDKWCREKAIELYKKYKNYYLSLEPITDYRAELAYLYELNNQQKEAIKEIKQVIMLDPNARFLSLLSVKNRISACEEMLKESFEVKLKAIDYLSRNEEKRSFSTGARDGSWIHSIAIPENSKISFFEKALQDKDVRIRLQALSGLRTIKDPKKIPLIEKALQDNDSAVRNLAKQLLAYSQNKK